MIDEHLAPPFPAPIRFQDVEPRVLREEDEPANQTMQPDIWEDYLRRILDTREH